MSRRDEYYLNLHALGEPDPPLALGEQSVCLRVDEFEQVLDEVRGLDNVHITFDDGNRSDLDHAVPALQARGMTARFFVLAGHFDTPGFLDEAALRDLHAAGMTIGSHGLDHRAWTQLTPDELEAELMTSKQRLEDLLGVAVDEAACPFGAYDRRVLNQLKRVGYKRVFTSDRGPARASDWLTARTTLHPGTALDECRATLRGANGRGVMRRAKLLAKRLR